MNYSKKSNAFDICEIPNYTMNEKRLSECKDAYCMCACHGMTKRRGQSRG